MFRGDDHTWNGWGTGADVTPGVCRSKASSLCEVAADDLLKAHDEGAFTHVLLQPLLWERVFEISSFRDDYWREPDMMRTETQVRGTGLSRSAYVVNMTRTDFSGFTSGWFIMETTGFLLVVLPGEYLFQCGADDEVVMWVAGRLICEVQGQAGCVRTTTVAMWLSSGYHSIRAELQHGVTEPALLAMYQGPDTQDAFINIVGWTATTASTTGSLTSGNRDVTAVPGLVGQALSLSLSIYIYIYIYRYR